MRFDEALKKRCVYTAIPSFTTTLRLSDCSRITRPLLRLSSLDQHECLTLQKANQWPFRSSVYPGRKLAWVIVKRFGKVLEAVVGSNAECVGGFLSSGHLRDLAIIVLGVRLAFRQFLAD